jgi:hypothetical protein
MVRLQKHGRNGHAAKTLVETLGNWEGRARIETDVAEYYAVVRKMPRTRGGRLP